MTNEEKYGNLSMTEQLNEAVGKDELCPICDQYVEKNLSPGYTCEGSWCNEALQFWLEEEAT